MTTYYVSTTGKDYNDGGSVNGAFRTIAKGVSKLRSGDILLVCGGTYEESDITFNCNNVTVSAYNDQQVTISGLRSIPPERWEEEENCFNAILPSCTYRTNGDNQVFVDDEVLDLEYWFWDANINVLSIKKDITDKKVKVKAPGDIAFDLSNKTGVSIINLNFVACRIVARFGSPVDANILNNLKFYHASSSYPAVALYGSCKVLNCDFYDSPGGMVKVTNGSPVIYNNTGFNLGSAIELVDTLNAVVENNTIFKTPLSLESPNFKFQYNHVFENNGIRILGNGEIAYNLIHDVESNCICIDATETVVHHNLCFRSSGSSIAILPPSPISSNYGDSQIKVINNTCDGDIELVSFKDREEESHAGTEIINNLAGGFKQEKSCGCDSAIPMGVRIEGNLFESTPIEGNLSGLSGCKDTLNCDYRLREESMAANIAIDAPPYATFDIGALEKNKAPFVAGAVITSLENLSIAWQDGYFEIGNLPKARVLPSTFKVKTNNRVASNPYSTVDAETGIAKGYVNFAGITGVHLVSMSLDGMVWTDPVSVDFKGPRIDKCTKNAWTLTIEGANFYTEPTIRIPLVYNLFFPDIKAHAVPLRLDTAELVARNLINADGSGFMLVDNAGRELEFAIEENTFNTASTVFWIKEKELVKTQPLYRDKANLWMICDSSLIFQGVSINKVFPILQDNSIDLWIKANAHPLMGADDFLAQITDFSGKGNHLVQSVKANQAQVILHGSGDLPAFSFNGKSTYYALPNSVTKDFENIALVAVFNNPVTDDSGKWQRVVSSGVGIDYEIGVFITPNQTSLGTPISSEAGILKSFACQGKDLRKFTIGRGNSGGNYFKGNLSELVVALLREGESFDVEQIATAFRKKYRINGIHPTLAPDLDDICYPLQVLASDRECEITSFSETKIIVALPAGFPYEKFQVKLIDSRNATAVFDFGKVSVPVELKISRITDLTGGINFKLGEPLVIHGANFANNSIVWFGEIPVSEIELIDATKIRVKLPTKVPLDKVFLVKVEAKNKFSNSMEMRINSTALVSYITPRMGAPGSIAYLVGRNFKASSKVYFGSMPAEILSISPSTVKLKVPLSISGLVEVSIVEPDGDIAADRASFDITLPNPAIVRLNPVLVKPGDAMSIEGDRFRAGAMVKIGNLPVDVNFVSSMKLTFTVPASIKGIYPIKVVNPDGKESNSPNLKII